MTWVCIEDGERFATRELAVKHCYQKVSKTSDVRVPKKRHAVFPLTGGGACRGSPGTNNPANGEGVCAS